MRLAKDELQVRFLRCKVRLVIPEVDGHHRHTVSQLCVQQQLAAAFLLALFERSPLQWTIGQPPHVVLNNLVPVLHKKFVLGKVIEATLIIAVHGTQ